MERMYQKFASYVTISLQEYLQAFHNLYLVTYITKFRDFQYRLLVNVIHINNRLVHWKIVPNKNCECCENEIQTITHLLWTCPKAQKLWDAVKIFICNNIAVDMNIIEFGCKNIFLNLIHPKVQNVCNLITLISKQYIYTSNSKCMQKNYSFDKLEKIIQNIYETEKYNAVINNNVHKHEEKWAAISGQK